MPKRRHVEGGALAAGNLNTLAMQINTEHCALEADFKSGLAHARRAGDLLIEAKAQIAHGQWLAWLTANCTVSERTAQAYMRLSRFYAKLAEQSPQRVADLSFREGLKLLAEPETGGSGTENLAEFKEALAPLALTEFVASALAFREILDGGLYQGDFGTFDEYCEKRHGIDSEMVRFSIELSEPADTRSQPSPGRCLATMRVSGTCATCRTRIPGLVHLPLDRVAGPFCEECCPTCNEPEAAT